MTIPDIRQFNPQLEQRNLVFGETILIPRKEETGGDTGLFSK
jgi:hypothetical protein